MPPRNGKGDQKNPPRNLLILRHGVPKNPLSHAKHSRNGRRLQVLPASEAAPGEFAGVRRTNDTGVFAALVPVGIRKSHHAGFFTSKEGAALAHDEHSLELQSAGVGHEGAGRLNFEGSAVEGIISVLEGGMDVGKVMSAAHGTDPMLKKAEIEMVGQIRSLLPSVEIKEQPNGIRKAPDLRVGMVAERGNEAWELDIELKSSFASPSPGVFITSSIKESTLYVLACRGDKKVGCFMGSDAIGAGFEGNQAKNVACGAQGWKLSRRAVVDDIVKFQIKNPLPPFRCKVPSPEVPLLEQSYAQKRQWAKDYLHPGRKVKAQKRGRGARLAAPPKKRGRPSSGSKCFEVAPSDNRLWCKQCLAEEDLANPTCSCTGKAKQKLKNLQKSGN